MGIILKIIGGFVAFIAAILALVFMFTGGIVDTADSFFAAVNRGDIESAYGELSKGFQASTSKDQLQQFLKNSSLSEYKEASWPNRSIETGRGRLGGVVTTTTGESVPLSIEFVKEGSEWKILGIKRTPPGLEGLKSHPTVPEAEQLVTLTQSSLAAFGSSIQAGDMSGFHAEISDLWRGQFTVEKLNEAYKPLFPLQTNWLSLAKLKPVFSEEPTIDENGVLNVKGYLPTKPDRLLFGYKYITERDQWRLVGVHINFKPAEE